MMAIKRLRKLYVRRPALQVGFTPTQTHGVTSLGDARLRRS